MWPFRFRTIFKNRWWTLAFVAFVCWQAAETVGSGTKDPDNAVTTDVTGAPVGKDDMKTVADAIKAL